MAGFLNDRVDRAIKMEQRGGEGNYLDLAWGREKMAGKVVKKKGGIPFFFFFFFPPRVTVGHVQNLNHPPRPAIRFISGEVSRGFRAAS